jgi:hypothetical protein
VGREVPQSTELLEDGLIVLLLDDRDQVVIIGNVTLEQLNELGPTLEVEVTAAHNKIQSI